MDKIKICCPGGSNAVLHASQVLKSQGFHVATQPDPETRHLLLPVPSFPMAENVYATIVDQLPADTLVSGGNLDGHVSGFMTVDFLKDPYYLAENAAITANCALRIVNNQLKTSIHECQTLVIGWGRIGKCLCRLLEAEGANITVAARKDTDRAMVGALGCRAIAITEAGKELLRYNIIINTVPEMVLPRMVTQTGCIILELASKPGMSGANIIDGRGLPNRMAPEESGNLIAQTFLRLSHRKEF